MRTTVNIDDELLEVAKSLASQRDISLGAAISELIRRGLRRDFVTGLSEAPFPTFEAPPGARAITSETVRQALEEE